MLLYYIRRKTPALTIEVALFMEYVRYHKQMQRNLKKDAITIKFFEKS